MSLGLWAHSDMITSAGPGAAETLSQHATRLCQIAMVPAPVHTSCPFPGRFLQWRGTGFVPGFPTARQYHHYRLLHLNWGPQQEMLGADILISQRAYASGHRNGVNVFLFLQYVGEGSKPCEP